MTRRESVSTRLRAFTQFGNFAICGNKGDYLNPFIYEGSDTLHKVLWVNAYKQQQDDSSVYLQSEGISLTRCRQDCDVHRNS